MSFASCPTANEKCPVLTLLIAINIVQTLFICFSGSSPIVSLTCPMTTPITPLHVALDLTIESLKSPRRLPCVRVCSTSAQLEIYPMLLMWSGRPERRCPPDLSMITVSSPQVQVSLRVCPIILFETKPGPCATPPSAYFCQPRLKSLHSDLHCRVNHSSLNLSHVTYVSSLSTIMLPEWSPSRNTYTLLAPPLLWLVSPICPLSISGIAVATAAARSLPAAPRPAREHGAVLADEAALTPGVGALVCGLGRSGAM